MILTSSSRVARKRSIKPAALASERLEPRMAPVSLAPTATEQVLLERINDQRVREGRTPLALDGRMQQIAVRAAEVLGSPNSVPTLKAALTKARVPWDSKDSITTGANASFIPVGTSPSEMTRMAEQLADGHSLTGSLGQAKYDRHRMVGVVVLRPEDQRNPFGGLGLTSAVDITASIRSRTPIVTGVAYRDANANGLYDAGEGVTGVRVTVTAPRLKAVAVQAWDTGGFTLPVNVRKTTTVVVTATGGGLAAPVTRTVQLTPAANTRVNFVLPT